MSQNGVFMTRTLLLTLLVLASISGPTPAYIDMPAEALTLPRLLMEYSSVGLYEISRVDVERGGVQYRLVETLQGRLTTGDPKHVIKSFGNIPAELSKLKVGQRAVIFTGDCCGRSVVQIEGAWYVTNYSPSTSWSYIAYTAGHYDFNCCFQGDTTALAESLKRLLRGEVVMVNSRKKIMTEGSQLVRYDFRHLHRKEVVAANTPTSAQKIQVVRDRAPVAEILQLLKDNAPFTRLEAAEALGRRGDDAKDVVPALVAVVKQDKDLFVRRGAAVALGELGPRAKDAVPELVALLLQNQFNEIERVIGREASVALARIDPEGSLSVPILTTHLKSDSYALRFQAVVQITMLETSAKAAIPAVLDSLKGDTWEDVRRAAAVALPQLRAEPQIAVPALAAALKDKNAYVRTAVAQTLGVYGTQAKSALPGLQAALNDPDAGVRQAAQEAVTKIQP